MKRFRPVLARLPADLERAAAAQGIAWLDLTPEHAITAGRLPRLHGDPFDRFIIAQAIREGATVVSADRWFRAYGLPVIW